MLRKEHLQLLISFEERLITCFKVTQHKQNTQISPTQEHPVFIREIMKL